MANKVIVTGVSGYVGRQLALQLHEKGYNVVGLARRAMCLGGVPIVMGDFSHALIAKDAIVIHCAGVTRSRDLAELDLGNLQPTKQLVDTCQKRQVKSLVYLSSDLAARSVGAYGMSKRQCEDYIMRSGLNALCLRLPPVVGNYAPTLNSTYSRLTQAIKTKYVLFLPAGGRFQVNSVHIDDIVESLDELFKLDGPLPSLAQMTGVTYELRSFIEKTAASQQVSPFVVSIPLGMVRLAARLLRKIGVGGKLPLDALSEIGVLTQQDCPNLLLPSDRRLKGLDSMVLTLGIPIIEC